MFMWNKNRKALICVLLISVLLLTMPSARAESDILEEIPEAQPYVTLTVTKETYTVKDSSMLEYFYPRSQTVTYQGGDAILQECLVAAKDEVKAGDVLARFTKEKDEVKFARLELALNKAELSMKEGTQQRQAKISEAKQNLALITDPYEKEIAELKLKYQETELEQYRYHQQKTVDRHQNALDEAYAELSTELIAPMDGTVDSVTRLFSGDAVSSGKFSITIQQKDLRLLTFPRHRSSPLRYNMKVEILTQLQPLSGRVVYADDPIPLAGSLGRVFFELDPEYADAEFVSASMTCDLYSVENIVKIPIYYLQTDNNENNYVTVLKDGKKQRRYVQVMLKDSGFVVIPMGLEEGEILIAYN